MILNADPTGGNAYQAPNGSIHIAGGSTSSPGSAPKLNFLGWGILLLGLYAWNGTKIGHETIYYSLVLIVLFLFIFNYKRIMPAITKN